MPVIISAGRWPSLVSAAAAVWLLATGSSTGALSGAQQGDTSKCDGVAGDGDVTCQVMANGGNGDHGDGGRDAAAAAAVSPQPAPFQIPAWVQLPPSPEPQPKSWAVERWALEDVYSRLDGPRWRFRDGWLTDAVMDDWIGVGTSTDGHVNDLRIVNNRIKVGGGH
jgi:hypothetical protein